MSIHGLGFRVEYLWFRVQGSGFRVQGSGFRVQGSGFRVLGIPVEIPDKVMETMRSFKALEEALQILQHKFLHPSMENRRKKCALAHEEALQVL